MALEDKLKAQIEKGDTLYFFFAGHGVPYYNLSEAKEWRPYLLPFDGYPKSIEVSGYELHKLHKVLAELPASRVIAFIDACFSSIDVGRREMRREPKKSLLDILGYQR